MTKTEIIARLGEAAVLLPELLGEALDANDRLKVRLSLLQAAVATAGRPAAGAGLLDPERRACGLGDADFDKLITGARPSGPGRIVAPGGLSL